MPRTFIDNTRIVKCFLVEGPINFYLPYYLEGNNFIKNIKVNKKDLDFIVKNTTNLSEKYDNGIIDEFELLEGFIQHLLLKNTEKFENKKFMPSSSLQMLYQFVADCIVGNITDMFKLIQQVEENGDVDYETIVETKYDVYSSIVSMISSLEAIGKAESETH